MAETMRAPQARGEQFERDGFVAIPNLEKEHIALVIGRKISGGTRSPTGTRTHMGLSSLFATWLARVLNPFHACLSLLHPRFPHT